MIIMCVHELLWCRSEGKEGDFWLEVTLTLLLCKTERRGCDAEPAKDLHQAAVATFPWIFSGSQDNPRQLEPPPPQLFLNNSCGFLIIRIEVSLSLKTGSQAHLITWAGIRNSSPRLVCEAEEEGEDTSQPIKVKDQAESAAVTSRHPIIHGPERHPSSRTLPTPLITTLWTVKTSPSN